MVCSRVLIAIVICLASLGLDLLAFAEGKPDRKDLQCRGEEKDPWLADFRKHFLSGDLLAGWAVERLGAPGTCEAEVTTTFDGEKFGRLRFAFKDGSTLAVETLPPEASRVMLSLAAGFKSEEEGRGLLERYVRKIGFGSEWPDPEERNENGKRVLTYWVGDPGDNAGASLVFDGNRLAAIQFSMAL